MCAVPGQVDDVPADRDARENPEGTQEELTCHASELQSERHAIVLREMNVEPMAEDPMLFAEIHRRLHPELHHLVDEQDQEDDDTGEAETSGGSGGQGEGGLVARSVSETEEG